MTPEAVTAFVMAYEEVTGGASTAALKPSDVVGLITKYAEAENVDVSALTSAQVEGIVTKFAEATGCDKSELLREFTAYITEYKEAAGVKKPTLNMQVGLSGYDLLAYRRWLRNNKWLTAAGCGTTRSRWKASSGCLKCMKTPAECWASPG